LSHVETALWELRSKRPSSTAPMPRIWLSIQRSYPFPSSLFNLCLIAYIRTPLSMKEAMTRSFSLIDNDLLRHSSKSEWIPLLHNICYLHCALNLRTRFGQAGWDIPSLTLFTNVELTSAFQVVAREFALCDQSVVRLESAHAGSSVTSNETNIRQLSWSSIRYSLSELIYGARTLSEYDQRAIANIVDFWIQPGSVKKDFEFSKIKYKIPTIFFTQQPKLNQLQQALESLSVHQLDVPEACHLHSTFETNLGDDVLIISRLNRILDALPPTISLNAAVHQRPNTPIEGLFVQKLFFYFN
jgi:dynein heavy chain